MSALGACPKPAYRYAYSKWRGEEIVRQSALNWTIFRPSLLYGNGFGFFNRLAQSLLMSPPFFAILPAAQTRFQPLAAADLAQCVLLVLKMPEAVGRIHEIGGPKHLTYSQMLDIWLAILGQKRIKLSLPLPFLRLVIPVIERVLATRL